MAALWYVPPSHGVHVDSPLFAAYEPAAHSVGAVAPSTHADPSGQATQAGCPRADWYLPSSQREHTDAPAAETLPAAQVVGTAAPVSHAEPAGHSTQSSSEVMEMFNRVIVAFWYRPEGHGRAAAAPLAQYEPGVHALHAVAPAWGWYLPATHCSQAAVLLLGATVPGLHGVCCLLPVVA